MVKIKYAVMIVALVIIFLCAAKIDGNTAYAEEHYYTAEGVYDAQNKTVITSDGNIWGYNDKHLESGYVTVLFDDMATDNDVTDDAIVDCAN